MSFVEREQERLRGEIEEAKRRFAEQDKNNKGPPDRYVKESRDRYISRLEQELWAVTPTPEDEEMVLEYCRLREEMSQMAREPFKEGRSGVFIAMAKIKIKMDRRYEAWQKSTKDNHN